MVLPPCRETEDGRPRKLGVEIEFAGMTCEQGAALVCELFGGRIRLIDAYRFEVADTRLGTFTVELDSQYAHTGEGEEEADGSDWGEIRRTVRNGLTTAIAAVTSLWVPMEVVAPPIPLAMLPELDRLVPALRRHGAEGTRDGLVYAFATQFNPEAPSLGAESVLAHLKAFLLLSGKLRKEIDVDLLRRALPFAKPFPKPYVRKVVDPAYQPVMPQLIDDYLEANPTRNRELDMLPLLSEIDLDRVRAKVDDALIKSRPTFHYRMPDTRLSDPDWSLITEWNRWVEVEQLAGDAEALRQLGEIFIAANEDPDRQALDQGIHEWRARQAKGR